eukprot:1328397-Amorphochlora_amoeboformis.AAC.1
MVSYCCLPGKWMTYAYNAGGGMEKDARGQGRKEGKQIGEIETAKRKERREGERIERARARVKRQSGRGRVFI